MAGVVYTIGHSNHTLERFVELLRGRGVEVVADARSIPYSKHAPRFNQDVLCEGLRAAGIEYVYCGKDLGGRPARPVDSPSFAGALRRLEDLLLAKRTAVLCAEEDPLRCHRWHHLTPALESRGVAVQHIRGDGRLETRADLEARGRGGQMPLFE